jgi:hypothetical protein
VYLETVIEQVWMSTERQSIDGKPDAESLVIM